MKQQNCR